MTGRRRRPHFRLETPPGVADFHSAGGRTAGDWETNESDERQVATHCAFCGVQCGMHLRVAGGRVIGVEPRMDTHNEGKLCPKGVAAYQQISHPDRLTHPLVRDGDGLRQATWDEALDRVVDGIGRIQAAGGPDAMAVYGGASMVNEKTYLLGKFARVGLGTRFTDYNGRMCMVSAGVANYRSFGIDRTANPITDLAFTDVAMVLGANVPETFPIYIRWFWEAIDRGATVICVDPRETSLARVAQLHLPIRPGTDASLLNAMLHVVIRNGHVDEAFVAGHTSGFDAVAAAVAEWAPERAADVCGVPAADIERAAELFGSADKAMINHARGLEHQVMGSRNAMAAINLCLATGNIGRPGAGYGTITGQGNGQGGREHGQKCDQLPGQRHFTDPGAIEHVAGVWGIDPADMPDPGEPIFAVLERMERGEVRGLLNICSNPMVSWPDEARTKRILETLELYVVIDIFLSESALLADVVLPGSAWAESEGVVANSDALVCKINKAVDPPGEAKGDMWILCELARRLGRGQYFPSSEPRDVFDEMCRASAGGRADYSGITYERLEAEGPIAWPCPSADHPGTPRLFEDLRFYTSDGRAHFNAIEVDPSAEEPDAEYPLRLTTGRTVAHYLSGNQTRRLEYLADQTPAPWVEIHPETAAEFAITEGAAVNVTSRRTTIVLPALLVKTIRPDTRVHPVPLGPARRRQPAHQGGVRPIELDPGVQNSRRAHRTSRRRGVDRQPASRLEGRHPMSMERSIFVDPSRCIGCGACLAACRECDTHRGKSMMNLDFLDRASSTAALPTVCMHCADPVAPCAQVCPVDAILVSDDGVVHSPDVSRCIGCQNCVHACPWGVPKFDVEEQLAYKCNLCYDRTSIGLGPMCATVCPSDALYYGSADDVRASRPGRRVIDVFNFGAQELQTGNAMVVPEDFAFTSLTLLLGP